MKAQAFIGRITEVRQHPEIAGLDVVAISGKTNVANREPAEGDAETFPRYQVGDYAVMLTENMILPEWLLKRLDMWDHVKGKGYCAGKLGNRLKTRRIPNKEGGILSEVALLPVLDVLTSPEQGVFVVIETSVGEGEPHRLEDDVAGLLGIEEIWEPST